MSIFEFLNTLESTLNTIEVKGKDNLNSLFSCLMAIDEYRNTLKSQIEEQMKQEVEQKPEDGGDEVGRQSDIGTESGSSGNGE